MLLSWICFGVSTAAITAGTLEYINLYKKEEKKQTRTLDNLSGKLKTDPGAYLCELARKGYIRFVIWEERLHLFLAEYPEKEEGTVKQLFEDIFWKAPTKMISDETAIVGREIIDYKDIKKKYENWVKNNNPGEEESKVKKKDKYYTRDTVKVKSKFDIVVYAFIFSVTVLAFSVSDIFVEDSFLYGDGISSIEIFMDWVMFTVFAGVGIYGILEVNESSNRVRAEGFSMLKNTMKMLLCFLVTLFFGILSIAVFFLLGKGTPMLILKCFTIIVAIALLLFQKIKGKWAKPRKNQKEQQENQDKKLLKEKLKPEYIIDSRELLGIEEKKQELMSLADRKVLRARMDLIEKVLWDEEK